MKKLLAFAVLMAGGAAYLIASRTNSSGAIQGGGVQPRSVVQDLGDAVGEKINYAFEGLKDWATPIYTLDGKPAQQQAPAQSRNMAAFLDMIAKAEGTLGKGDNGYNILFGGGTFSGYAWHPRIAKQFYDKASGRNLWTTAAGRYQFMCASPTASGGHTSVDTWTRIAKKIGLRDFSPASQDLAAIELIKERGAYAAVMAGQLVQAVNLCGKEWASLPNNNYQQNAKSLAYLQTAFVNAGGVLA